MQIENEKSTRFLGHHAIGILSKWFESNSNYPYPDDPTTDHLAKEANISCKQVKKWFANKRVRSQLCCKVANKLKNKSANQNNVQAKLTKMPMHKNQNKSTPIIINNELPSNATLVNSNLMHQVANYNPLLLMHLLASSSPLNFKHQKSLFSINPQTSDYQMEKFQTKHQNKQKCKYDRKIKTYNADDDIQRKNCLLATEQFKTVDLEDDLAVDSDLLSDKDSPILIKNLKQDDNNNRSLQATSNSVKSYAFCDQNKLAFKKRRFEFASFRITEPFENSYYDPFNQSNSLITCSRSIRSFSGSLSPFSSYASSISPQLSTDSSD